MNYLFLLVPLMNVTLPFLWKSFPFIFVTNAIALVGAYAYKGVWNEVYGIPLGAAGGPGIVPVAAAPSAEGPERAE